MRVYGGEFIRWGPVPIALRDRSSFCSPRLISADCAEGGHGCVRLSDWRVLGRVLRHGIGLHQTDPRRQNGRLRPDSRRASSCLREMTLAKVMDELIGLDILYAAFMIPESVFLIRYTYGPTAHRLTL